MRAILIAVLLVAVLVLVGWISFRYNGSRAAVTLETERIEADTERLVEEGREAVQDVRERAAEIRRQERIDENRQP